MRVMRFDNRTHEVVPLLTRRDGIAYSFLVRSADLLVRAGPESFDSPALA